MPNAYCLMPESIKRLPNAYCLMPELFKSFVRPFDLSQAPLLRVGIIESKEADSWLLVDIHHIVTDGVSMEILRKEFASLAAGERLPSLRLQYRDFSGWQHRLLETGVIEKQEAYWVKTFAGEIPVLTLPYDNPRPRLQSFDGGSTDFVLGGQAVRQLKRIAKEVDATLYMTILSLFAILYSKLSGQEDIIIGTPIANRRHADLERIIGMFVNTLPIRSFPTGEKTYVQLLMEVKENTLEVFENQEYQFEDLVEKVVVQRDTGRNPIFDVVFNLLNLSSDTGDRAIPANRDSYSQEPGLDGKHKYEHRQGTSKFDLSATALDLGETRGKGILFTLEYNTRLFKAGTIERFISYFKRIVENVLEHPRVKISGCDPFSTKL